MLVKSVYGRPSGGASVSGGFDGAPCASEFDGRRQCTNGIEGFRIDMSGRRVVAALLAMMLGAAMISFLPGVPSASADGAPPDSALTKSGEGVFANLQVTVSQTKNLINQVITVAWQGGVPTEPLTGAFGANYLQIMQCWGDDPEGPERTQCQYGRSGQSTPIAGAWVRSRQVHYVGVLDDQKETLAKPAGNTFVPFWPVGHPQPTDPADGDNNDFFDPQVTNEVPLARTGGDGAGVVHFEVETVSQAAGLGCGDPVTVSGATKGRSCWLVIVPRGNIEVDGSSRLGTNTTSDGLQSSPLSQTNWDNRIVFPLEFLPVGQACPIGSPERRMVGHELVVDAVTSWQPALCAGGGALFSYSQLGDDVARAQVVSGNSPGLALVTNPIPPDQVPPDQPLVYAPVGLSGLAIAFNIEHQPVPGGPPENLKLDGVPFTSMKLTPRLVAKLLTQSYQGAVNGPPGYRKDSSLGLTVDPEFLELNPDYKGFSFYTTPPDALVQLGSADVTSLLWSWVEADPDARAFLAGNPDKFGMVVNPFNKDLSLPTSMFPRNDQSCTDLIDALTQVKYGICTLDVHPFTNDMHEAGRAASRGDSLARKNVVDAQTKQINPQTVNRQSPGQRALLTVVDTATAAQYGLSTAALRNAAGQFVTPTTASLQAGEAAMTPSAAAGVLASNPGATDPTAYPLAALSYAVTAPSMLDITAGKDYAAFLRYVAGPGQQPGIEPGQLPPGMAPLPDTLKAQAVAAAATIEAQAGKSPDSPPTPQLTMPGDVPGGAIGSTSSPTAAPGPETAATNSVGGPSAPPAGVPAPGPGSPRTKVPSVVQQPVAGVRRTPSSPVPAVGALLLTLLVCGGLAAMSSPMLQSPAIHWFGAAVRRLRRRGATPTEQ
jgi:hypothetical protein